MTTYHIKPPPGERLLKIDAEVWRTHAPSARVTDVFPDGTANVDVDDREADDLTDHFDDVGIEYEMM